MPDPVVPGPPAAVLAAISNNPGTGLAPSNPEFTGRAFFTAQDSTWPVSANLMTEIVQMPQSAELNADVTADGYLSTQGLVGATAATRWVGATMSGAPVSGAFLAGDFVIDQTGALWVCTAAGSPGSWSSVAGGGVSAITRMPWNLLGGWVGSSYDVGLALSGFTQESFTPSTGRIYAHAVTVDTATAFSTVVMLGNSAQTGTGSIVIVTSSAGNLLATATNSDAAFTGISSSPSFVNLTLGTTITPGAAQTLYYVMTLWPTATVSVAPALFEGGQLPNWAAGTQGSVAHPSGAASSSGSNTSIPNPQALSGLGINTNPPLWCAFK